MRNLMFELCSIHRFSFSNLERSKVDDLNFNIIENIHPDHLQLMLLLLTNGLDILDTCFE